MLRRLENVGGYFANTWVLSNPRLVYRACRGFFRAMLLRKNTLKTIEVFPTMECNLRCKMCSAQKLMKNEGLPLEIADYERIAREGARLGAIAVTLVGGEPLLAANLDEIIAVFEREKFFVYMVSNSLLVSAERLRELRRAGLNSICFSLDSLDDKENDRIRRRHGHHTSVMRAIKAAKDAGLIVSIAPVFLPGAVDEAIKVIRFCQEHDLGASGGQVAPIGSWEGKPILSAAEHQRVRHLLKEYPRLTFDWALSYFLKMRCPAGKEKIAITQQGDVMGCSINPISFGNIRDEPLRTILGRMQRFSEIKRDSPRCLVTEDVHYIGKYLHPLSRFDCYPVHFRNHPAFSPTTDAELYR